MLFKFPYNFSYFSKYFFSRRELIEKIFVTPKLRHVLVILFRYYFMSICYNNGRERESRQYRVHFNITQLDAVGLVDARQLHGTSLGALHDRCVMWPSPRHVVNIRDASV